jgi:hypothetical protein
VSHDRVRNRNGAKKGSAVYQERIFKRSWDSNINPARTGTSSPPRKAQNITLASIPQNNLSEGSHTNIREILLASVDYEAGLECLIVINS